jgi:hypothetical protein
MRALAGTLLAVFPLATAAHAFGQTYVLPLPFWMYAFAASAALALSFAVVGYFATAKSAAGEARAVQVESVQWGQGAVLGVLRALGMAVLLLTMLTALIGTPNPFANFGVTFFWIVFVLGFTYVVALIGDVYAPINPWRSLCDLLEWRYPGTFRARIAYPEWLGYYPALVLYMAFIWTELFAHASPRGLGVALLAYTLINLGGARLFGPEAWFRHGEMFAVVLRLIGKMAPLEYTSGRLRLRQPFVGLLKESADHPSLLLIVLFMLSSTAFDGVHQTLPWVTVFWKQLYPPLAALFSQPYLFFVDIYYYWQWAMLFLSPFFYLAIYLAFIWLMKRVARSERPMRELALEFTLPLVPIAFVYHVTHYYTLLVGQAPAMVPLVSDPFGWGWNLFGTARQGADPVVVPADWVWHSQVALILVGHVVSVYLAHARALEIFPRARQAVWSQLPMLILMVAFTTAGLWILSLPIAGGQVMVPQTSAIGAFARA